MRAAIRILTAEQRWLALAMAGAERELAKAADLAVEARLREQLRQLDVELAEVVEALGVLKTERTARRTQKGAA